MAEELYKISLTLSEEQIKIAKHWADLPGNYGTPAHYTHIATQLIWKHNYKLDDAVLVYAKHGIALNEALISAFKAKYTYSLIRPMSYIKNVMAHADWNTVVGTPPHPEYPSAHSVIGGASSTILAAFFGKNHSFVDRTHEDLYGSRTYSSPKAYAEEAGFSRVLGGIHYKLSADVGLVQGEKVGKLVNNVPFKGHGDY
jgi:membrane-associated phospholipid phosphatase